MDATDNFIFQLGHWVLYVFAFLCGIPLLVNAWNFWKGIIGKVKK